MAILSWIKGKYYNYKLESADNKFKNGDVEQAVSAYKELLDKHIEAVVHLSNLYVNNCSSNELKLQRLLEIQSLVEFVNDLNKDKYQHELNVHVANICGQSERLFVAKNYKWAVSLSDSIQNYKKNDSVFEDKRHRYKAYFHLSTAEECEDNSGSLDKCIYELKQITQSKEKDIRNLYQLLESKSKYSKVIYLLTPFCSLSKEFSKGLVDCIVNIVCLNDTNNMQFKNISSIFDKDIELCKLAASEIASLAEKSASKYQYSEAVRLDLFASEYLSDDNSFNNLRCIHILEELSSRTNSVEVSKLFTLAKTLKLSDSQISILKKRTEAIAKSAEPEKAINICKLFINDVAFINIYIIKAKDLATSNQQEKIDSKELRSVITLVSDSKSLEKTLSQFVDYIKPFKDEYYQIVYSLYNQKNKEKAYELCDILKEYTLTWIHLFLNLRKKDLSLENTITEKIKFHQVTINKLIKTVENLDKISIEEYSILWNSYKELILKKSDSQPKDKAIISISELRSQILNYCSALSDSDVIISELTLKIVKLRWSYATELEEDLSFEAAISQYESIEKEKISSYTNRAEFRLLICYLKSNKVTESTENRIIEILKNKSFASLKEDLAYGYSLYLLKHTRPSEAQKIITEFLPDERKLNDFCNNIFIKESENKLAEFNNYINRMSKGELSSDDALSFYKKFNSNKNVITNKLLDTKDILNSYKNKIESYILEKLFSEEQYSIAFDKLMTLHPDFIQNDIAYRNIAICSLCFLDKNETDHKKVKMAIAIWLSAVHTDRLFVNCLDYTSWDDQYTFTLQDSLGNTSNSDYDELPSNINFDSPVDNQNISIKDVQNSLLTRIEEIIHSNYPEYEEFYNSEKNAIEGLILLNLDEGFIMATPYLANIKRNIHESISDALDYDYQQNYDNNEDVLALGVIYGLSNEVYQEYADAKKIVETCKDSLYGSLQNLRSAFASIIQIKKYENLYSSLKSIVSTTMNESIKSEQDFKVFIDRYEIICESLNDTAISLSCANYVNGKVVRLLNDDSIKERDGVGYLVRIYNIAPSNIQVKQNLEGVMCNLARNSSETPNKQDEAAIHKALRDTKNEFKSKVEDAYIQGILNGIIEKVNNDKMDKSKALKAVYDLYVKYSNNDRVCENLVTICDICIRQYVINDAWGASTVKSILNKIDNNKSVVFKRHAKKLAKEYSDVWNQIPYDTQLLLKGIGGYNRTLNDNGRALQAGLEFYKKLGSVSDTGIFGKLF